MEAGVAPVIISDDWIVPMGPDWSSFAIFIKEREIDKLESVLLHHEPQFHQMGKNAAQAFLDYFAPEKYFDYIIDQIVLLKRRNSIILQYAIWKARNVLAKYGRARNSVRRRLTKPRSGAIAA